MLYLPKAFGMYLVTLIVNKVHSGFGSMEENKIYFMDIAQYIYTLQQKKGTSLTSSAQSAPNEKYYFCLL